MKKILLACGLATCFPLVAAADNVELEKELNGLDIQTEVVGDTGTTAGPATGGTSGVQALRVTNNGDVTANCRLEPHPSEPAMTGSPETLIEAGDSATLRLEGSYSSATIRSKLVCEEES
ncbi:MULTISPECIES: hypothetical protein [Pseudomonas]|uniref:hypothetical protein n=1 Tax=Pseudomonas TaxID=286 RepID=UPI00123A3C1B|nr:MULTISPECIES: hypothetical protein [Pseudomonas]QIB50293.1 hypothetical protein G3M63_03920 [Pseudomonas sp. OIL-1]